MKKEEIHFGDLSRWLFGQTPPLFMIEVVIRTILIYVILLLVVRQMGKRMSGQTTITEFAVMVTLGAIVSPVMQLPDRAILFGVVVLGCTYTFQRGINLWAFKRQKAENITQGQMSMLVKDGILMLEELENTRVSRQQLFAKLREENIYNLAKVERLYLEACGVFSIYETTDNKPGLPVMPPSDTAILDMQHQVDSGRLACSVCGQVQLADLKETRCQVCHSSEWRPAYTIKNEN
jgi:uncharacterized membrane protein YcaP (DUF421 family)